MCVCVRMYTYEREEVYVCVCMHVYTLKCMHILVRRKTPAYTCIQRLEVDVWCLPQLLST